MDANLVLQLSSWLLLCRLWLQMTSLVSDLGYFGFILVQWEGIFGYVIGLDRYDFKVELDWCKEEKNHKFLATFLLTNMCTCYSFRLTVADLTVTS